MIVQPERSVGTSIRSRDRASFCCWTTSPRRKNKTKTKTKNKNSSSGTRVVFADPLGCLRQVLSLWRTAFVLTLFHPYPVPVGFTSVFSAGQFLSLLPCWIILPGLLSFLFFCLCLSVVVSHQVRFCFHLLRGGRFSCPRRGTSTREQDNIVVYDEGEVKLE